MNEMGVFSRGSLGVLAVIGGLALSLSGEAFAQPPAPATAESRPVAHAPKGHQTEAPPWSFACITDHGPRPCGEPMWVYQ